MVPTATHWAQLISAFKELSLTRKPVPSSEERLPSPVLLAPVHREQINYYFNELPLITKPVFYFENLVIMRCPSFAFPCVPQCAYSCTALPRGPPAAYALPVAGSVYGRVTSTRAAVFELCPFPALSLCEMLIIAGLSGWKARPLSAR